MSPILEFRRATKTFRGIPAIKDIDFTLGAGEIHAIVGENGAGKSTLMKVLAGVYELTSGESGLRRPASFASNARRGARAAASPWSFRRRTSSRR